MSCLLSSWRCLFWWGMISGCVANEGIRIHTLEQQLGAGLIEEVVQVAEGELQLIDTMEKSKV